MDFPCPGSNWQLLMGKKFYMKTFVFFYREEATRRAVHIFKETKKEEFTEVGIKINYLPHIIFLFYPG